MSARTPVAAARVAARTAASLARGLVALLTLAAAGCGKPVLRVADASLGDYYSEKEYESLSKEQREEYCRDLANQRETFQDEIKEDQAALAILKAKAETQGRESDSLGTLAGELEAKLAVADRKQRAPASNDPEKERSLSTSDPDTAYVVKAGDSLWRISGRAEIFGDGAKWKALYEANRGRVKSPDRIYPGQEIRIPR